MERVQDFGSLCSTSGPSSSEDDGEEDTPEQSGLTLSVCDLSSDNPTIETDDLHEFSFRDWVWKNED